MKQSPGGESIIKAQAEGAKLLEAHYRTQFDLDRKALRRKIMPKIEKGPVLWKDLTPFEKAALYRLLYSAKEGGDRYAITDAEWDFIRKVMPSHPPAEEQKEEYEIYARASSGLGLVAGGVAEQAYRQRLLGGTEEAKERMREKGEIVEGEKPGNI